MFFNAAKSQIFNVLYLLISRKNKTIFLLFASSDNVRQWHNLLASP